MAIGGDRIARDLPLGLCRVVAPPLLWCAGRARGWCGGVKLRLRASLCLVAVALRVRAMPSPPARRVQMAAGWAPSGKRAACAEKHTEKVVGKAGAD